ncbi:MAG: peptidase S41, partial [Planctomycetota bacterium]
MDRIEQGSMQRATDWTKLRKEAIAMAGAAATTADTYAAIRTALAALGDRHSFLVTPAEAK